MNDKLTGLDKKIAEESVDKTLHYALSHIKECRICFNKYVEIVEHAEME